MIEYTSGDILQCEADALVNTVNCVGVMGRGIALQFKNVYPENFKGLRGRLQTRSRAAWSHVRFETGQLTRRASSSTSHQAPLARQEPYRGHRCGPCRSGQCHPRQWHPLHRHPAAGRRPGRAGLERGATTHRARTGRACRSTRAGV